MRGIYQIRTVDIFEISVLTNSQCTTHHCRVRAAGEVNANDHHKLWGHWKRTHKQADIRRGGLFDRVSERYTRARPFQTKHRALLTQYEKRRGHERPDHPWFPHQKTKPRIGWQNIWRVILFLCASENRMCFANVSSLINKLCPSRCSRRRMRQKEPHVTVEFTHQAQEITERSSKLNHIPAHVDHSLAFGLPSCISLTLTLYGDSSRESGAVNQTQRNALSRPNQPVSENTCKHSSARHLRTWPWTQNESMAPSSGRCLLLHTPHDLITRHEIWVWGWKPLFFFISDQ